MPTHLLAGHSCFWLVGHSERTSNSEWAVTRPPWVPRTPEKRGRYQMLGSRSKYSSSSFDPPCPFPNSFSVRTNSIRSIHFTIL